MAKDAAGEEPARQGPNRSRKAGRGEPLFGAIDLGTNNCRMLLARKTREGFRVVDAYSRIVRLGEGLGASGRLSDEAMERAIEALSVCAQRIERKNVQKLRAIATEACRRAANGVHFIERVKAETGLDLEIVTAEEEARLAVQGSLDLLDETLDAAVVVDIGGGSTELCWVDLAEWRARGGLAEGGRPPLRGWSTMPMGVVTLSEQFPEPEGESERAEWYEAMKAQVRQYMKPPKGARRLRPLFETGRAHMVGTSGTVTSVAGVYLNLDRYDRSRVDGLWLDSADAREVCARLASKDADGRSKEGCIGTERADLVLAGCAILETVMDSWPTERMRVGDRGLREGLLLNLMRKKRRRGRRGRGRSSGKDS
ncbi:Ppx/GppA phosphatase family protein [Marinicauda sp. Alg238-R41]|jgi:exopolyphosphatase/guanosine-5'-triphosphate,3'-diphosphate pyrophosphatase|uniref:Ppx/GppA phosphatase family protein n=1 Tax=Marinicauda sp. Alg238-R41 TaxID=2993447 RepID=UPI0022E30331|nr:Ppx/GppA phosphatase family protein [Marinicauda sp. Alg238-R41]